MGLTVLIMAAGSGSRMNINKTKQRIILGGKSILRRTVEIFDKCDAVDSITVVSREDELNFAKEELEDIKKLRGIVVGGETRLKSVINGVRALSSDTEFVAIHDAARCFISNSDIKKIYEDAKIYGAATASNKITDTVKMTDKDGNIQKTVDRSSLISVQTPQIFNFKMFIEALETVNCDDISITDDNMIFERCGYSVYPTETSKTNIKITVREDLEYAEFLLRGEC